MSNFRTIRDLPSNNSRPSYVPLDIIPTKNAGSTSTSASSSPTRSEPQTSFKDEVKGCFNALFGDFKFQSFTFICTMVQIAVFICGEIYSLTQYGNEDHVYSCVLYKLGAAHTPSLVVFYHLHRLVTPMFLHGDAGHIFSNLICQWSFGFKLEAIYGTKKFALLFFLSGISGSLLSAASHHNNIAVGASTACFGLVAWWCAHLIDNYDNLGPSRNRQIYWMAMMLLWNIVGAANSERIDNQGHAGIETCLMREC